MPDWEVAHTVDEAREAARRFLDAGAGKVVVKAQVLVGGRGKAGGVKLAGSVDEAAAVAEAILGMDIKGMTVRKVLIGAGRGHRQGVLPVGRPRPGRAADPADGLRRGRGRDRAGRRGRTPTRSSAATPTRSSGSSTTRPATSRSRWASAGTSRRRSAIAKGLVTTMRAYDADLVEINPLAIVRETGAGRRRGRAPRLPRRQGHPRRLRAGAAPRARGRCATPTRRRRPTRRRARPGSRSSSSTARSAAWSTARGSR